MTLHLAEHRKTSCWFCHRVGVPPTIRTFPGHGDDNGLVFGEYLPDIDTTMLVAGSMPAGVIAGGANLPETIVLSTACETGGKAFASAFLNGGVRAYIAPDGSPDGRTRALFVHHLFHQLLVRKDSLRDAFELARAYGDECRMFVGRAPALL